MNYCVKYTRIKSNWFDSVGKNKMNQYEKIGGYKGLYLYFQLYKFKIFNQENEETFLTSISMLRKETGFSTTEILELLKKMKTAKVIELKNVARWDYLIDERIVKDKVTGEYKTVSNIRDKDILHIIAADTPQTTRKQKTNKNGDLLFKDKEKKEPVMIDSPVTDDDFFIPINLEMFNLYKVEDDEEEEKEDKKKVKKKKDKKDKPKMYGTGSHGESIEKYVALYCLINKWNNNIESKMNMRIEKIANILKIDKDYIHKMIYSMNRFYFLQSTRRSRKSGSGFYFEHYICWSASSHEQFKEQVKEKCDKLVARYDKRLAKNKNKKAAVNLEDAMETTGEIDDTKETKKEQKGFGSFKERQKVLDSPIPIDAYIDNEETEENPETRYTSKSWEVYPDPFSSKRKKTAQEKAKEMFG